MRKIYIKNYKGFKEEFINLFDINFFVGENSTGKTSILNLINILSKQDFWINASFDNNEVELGYFNEIINKNSEEKTFLIGIELPIKNKNKRFLFEFKNKDNIPQISKSKISMEDTDILIKYKSRQSEFIIKNSSELSFEEWVKDLDFPEKSNKINISTNMFPFSFIMQIIEDQVRIEKSNQKGTKIEKSNQKRIDIRNPLIYHLYKNYTWLAPIRAKPKRIYESYKIKFSPEGDHIPSLLRNIFLNKKHNSNTIETLKNFGKESNLFDDIKINNFVKNSSPFEINILYNGTNIKLPNVGYGVSQALPLIIEILARKGYCLSIQQPEVHLHPKAQGAFGSFLFNSFLKNKNKFLIETHSDFTINRFRYETMKYKNPDKPKAQILFFERFNDGLKLNTIKIDELGQLENAPVSYREFFIDEELQNLEI